MKIIVASQNPVKINATKIGFKKIFPNKKLKVEGISAQSGVPDQPMGDKETFKGALNRVNNVSKLGKADFYVGIEGGITQEGNEMTAAAWVVIKDKKGNVGKGKTGTFLLPPDIVNLVKQGKELGEADDIVFKRSNSKQKDGAVGILTGGIIDRTRYYTHAVVLALIPFNNKSLFFKS